MKILIDAFGGDNSPLEPIKGAVMAKKQYNAVIALVGDINIIKDTAKKNMLDIEGIELFHADDVVLMTDPPLSVRSKPNSSLRVGFDLLKKGKVDAFISAGSTGAIHTGASLYVGRCGNLRRSAIATILPLANPVLLIDAGANANPNPEHLAQFAVMGSIYMKHLMGIDNPRVGLLNIGTEEHKGSELQVETYKLLKNTASINFVGNIEGNGVTSNCCDVLVTDGFSGNVLLKTIEGTSKLLMLGIKEIFSKNIFTMLSSLFVKKHVTEFKNRFKASTYGGSPLLGISKPVIKAHGSADDITIFNAVKQAITFIERNIIKEIDMECNNISKDQ